MRFFFLKKDSPLRALITPLFHAQRYRFMIAIVAIPISSVMAMLAPYLTKVAIDDYILPVLNGVNADEVMGSLIQLIFLAVGVVVVGYLADAIYITTMQRAGQSLIADLRDLVFRRTLRLPRGYFDTHPIGTVLTRVTSDIEALGESLATNALSLVVDFLKALAYLAMMFLLNWRLTLVLLGLLPVLLFLIVFFQNRVRKTFFVARQALSEATGYLQECLSGIKTVQLYGAESLVNDRFREKNMRFFQAQNTSNFYDSLLFSLVEGVTSLSLALMIWYAAGELLTGLITLGVLVAFMEYIQRLFVPVREFTQQIAVLQRAMAALDHINELVRVPLDEAEVGANGVGVKINDLPAEAGPGVSGDMEPYLFEKLEFENVHFRYRKDTPEILQGISFTLNRGETLAIVGATGSGKSTLIRLLTRSYGGYEGSIRINGEELKTIPAERLSRLISMVHQNVFLYQGSLAFNIGMAREHISREIVEQAARYVNADHFIERMEGGYDAQVLQGGINLSAGEGQLISFARAVAAQTELIVLDEATSSVDSLTENLIQQTVGRLYQDRTVIAIAHRLSTIRNADQILVMDKGLIAERGNHAELIAREGLYAALVGAMEAQSLPERETIPEQNR